MFIIGIGGGKGGCCKSTTAINLAAELHTRGRRVLLVDADPQGTTTCWATVAGEQQRSGPTVVTMGANMHRPDQLPQLALGFDVVIIDGPPRFGDVQRSMLLVSTVILLPCVPSTSDVWALSASIQLVEEARAQLRPELLAAVVLVRTTPRAAIVRSSREALGKGSLPVLSAELGQRVAFPEALAAGLGVTAYEPDGTAAQEVRALVDEVLALAPAGPQPQTRRGR